MREIIPRHPESSRLEVARLVCQRFGGRRQELPAGRLVPKEHVKLREGAALNQIGHTYSIWWSVELRKFP